MRKGRRVATGLVGVVAAMTGCSNNAQTADCVDAQGNVLPDSYCQGYSGGGYGGGYGGGGGGVVVVHSGGPHWVYGGNVVTGGGVRRVSGGSMTPSGSGEISTRSGTTVRGGFGGSTEGHGSFGFGHGGFGHGGG